MGFWYLPLDGLYVLFNYKGVHKLLQKFVNEIIVNNNTYVSKSKFSKHDFVRSSRSSQFFLLITYYFVARPPIWLVRLLYVLRKGLFIKQLCFTRVKFSSHFPIFTSLLWCSLFQTRIQLEHNLEPPSSLLEQFGWQ